VGARCAQLEAAIDVLRADTAAAAAEIEAQAVSDSTSLAARVGAPVIANRVERDRRDRRERRKERDRERSRDRERERERERSPYGAPGSPLKFAQIAELEKSSAMERTGREQLEAVLKSLEEENQAKEAAMRAQFDPLRALISDLTERLTQERDRADCAEKRLVESAAENEATATDSTALTAAPTLSDELLGHVDKVREPERRPWQRGRVWLFDLSLANPRHACLLCVRFCSTKSDQLR
jgi:chromosome segregation ATPase